MIRHRSARFPSKSMLRHVVGGCENLSQLVGQHPDSNCACDEGMSCVLMRPHQCSSEGFMPTMPKSVEVRAPTEVHVGLSHRWGAHAIFRAVLRMALKHAISKAGPQLSQQASFHQSVLDVE